ncbi:MAG: hypothetical protein GY769_02630 [bacterium]|nr:hypothetical protein [bacterium]
MAVRPYRLNLILLLAIVAVAPAAAQLVTLGDGQNHDCYEIRDYPEGGYEGGLEPIIRVIGDGVTIRNCGFRSGLTAVQLDGAGSVTITDSWFGHPDHGDREFADALITGSFTGTLILEETIAWAEKTGWDHAIIDVVGLVDAHLVVRHNVLFAQGALFVAGDHTALTVEDNSFRTNPGTSSGTFPSPVVIGLPAGPTVVRRNTIIPFDWSEKVPRSTCVFAEGKPITLEANTFWGCEVSAGPGSSVYLNDFVHGAYINAPQAATLFDASKDSPTLEYGNHWGLTCAEVRSTDPADYFHPGPGGARDPYAFGIPVAQLARVGGLFQNGLPVLYPSGCDIDLPDGDGDDIVDLADTCREDLVGAPAPSPVDTDGDGVADACDCAPGLFDSSDDTDGDGAVSLDCFGLTSTDTEGSGMNVDADDADASVYPGAPEECDCKDNDGDGLIDEEEPCICDADGDGAQSQCCGGTDCNDEAASIHPDANEVCSDGIDQNCDPSDDDYCCDLDGDNWPAAYCAGPYQSDCDDSRADVYPGAPEACDDADNDCDGFSDEGFLADNDDDLTYVVTCATGAHLHPNGMPLLPCNHDCNDADATVHPFRLGCYHPADYPEVEDDIPESGMDARACDGIDNDCNGLIDEVAKDTDGDGSEVYICADPPDANPDCDDNPLACGASCYPGNPGEACDGWDNDCDGRIDEGEFEDRDGDGSGLYVDACGVPRIYECYSESQGSVEFCRNDIDDDGDGTVDEHWRDLDHDGEIDEDGCVACSDCDDRDPRRANSLLEICGDGVDNDCDGLIDDGDVCSHCSEVQDNDRDGHPYPPCSSDPYLADCDDFNPNTWRSCETCQDGDGDGYWAGCETYVSVFGPDCDDNDGQRWVSCPELDIPLSSPLVDIVAPDPGDPAILSPVKVRVVFADPDGIDGESLLVTADFADVTGFFRIETGEATGLLGLTEGGHVVCARVADSMGNQGMDCEGFQVGLTQAPVRLVAPGYASDARPYPDEPPELRAPRLAPEVMQARMLNHAWGGADSVPEVGSGPLAPGLPLDFHYANHYVGVSGGQQAAVRTVDFASRGRGGLHFELVRQYSSDAERVRRLEARQAIFLQPVYEHLAGTYPNVDRILLENLDGTDGVTLLGELIHAMHKLHCATSEGMVCNVVSSGIGAANPVAGAIAAAACAADRAAAIAACFIGAGNAYGNWQVNPTSPGFLETYAASYFVNPLANDNYNSGKCPIDYFGHNGEEMAKATPVISFGPWPPDRDCMNRMPSDPWVTPILQYRPRSVGPIWNGEAPHLKMGALDLPHYAPIAYAQWVLDIIAEAREKASARVNSFSTSVRPFLRAEAARLKSARKDPIRFGLGAGWSLNLPYLEFPDPATERPGFVHFDGQRAAEYRNPQAAVFPAEEAILWAADPAVAPPEPDGATCDHTDPVGGVTRDCLLTDFGQDTFMLATGVPVVQGTRRPELVYRLSVLERIYYFDEVGLLRVITDPTHNNSIEISWATTHIDNLDALQNAKLDTIVDAAGNTYSFTYWEEPFFTDARADFQAREGAPAELAESYPGYAVLPDPPLVRSISSSEKTVRFTYRLEPVRVGGELIPSVAGDGWWTLQTVEVEGADTQVSGTPDASALLSFDYEARTVFVCEPTLDDSGQRYCGVDLTARTETALHGVYLSGVTTPTTATIGGTAHSGYADFIYDDHSLEFAAGEFLGVAVYDLPTDGSEGKYWEYEQPCEDIPAQEDDPCTNRGLFKLARGPEVARLERSVAAGVASIDVQTFTNNWAGRGGVATDPVIYERTVDGIVDRRVYELIDGAMLETVHEVADGSQTWRVEYDYSFGRLDEKRGCLVQGCDTSRVEKFIYGAESGFAGMFSTPARYEIHDAKGLRKAIDLRYHGTYPWLLTQRFGDVPSTDLHYFDGGGHSSCGSLSSSDPAGSLNPVAIYREYLEDSRRLEICTLYNEFGAPIESRDPEGITATFRYAPFDHGGGRVVKELYLESVIRSKGVTSTIESFQHDSFGRLLSRVDASGAPWSYDYDSVGRLVRRTDAQYEETFTYTDTSTFVHYRPVVDPPPPIAVMELRSDEHGRLYERVDSRRDPEPGIIKTRVTRYGYDGRDRPVWQDLVSPAGEIQRREVVLDGLGRVASITRGNGTVTGYTETRTYDDVLTARPRAPGPPTTEVTITNPGGTVFHYHDALGRRVAIALMLDGVERVWTQEYDSRGRLVLSKVPAAAHSVDPALGYQEWDVYTALAYDSLDRRTDRVVAARAPGVTVTAAELLSCPFDETAGANCSHERWTYTDSGRIETRTDPRGEVWKYTYDDLGRPDSITNPLSQIIDLSADELGRVTSSCWLGACTQNEYDHRGLVTRRVDGEQHAVRNEYNFFGERTLEVDETTLHERSWIYDVSGQVRRYVDQEDNAFDWLYDWRGLLYESVEPRGEVSRRYYTPDPLGRIERVEGVAEAGGARAVLERFAYDDLDRIETRTYEGGATYTYQYNVLGKLASRDRDGFGGGLTYTHSPSGALIAREDETGVRANWGYDQLGRVTSESSGPREAPLEEWRYVYDRAGNLRESHNPLGAIDTYGYDAIGRITARSIAGAGSWAFAYTGAYERTVVATDPLLDTITVTLDRRYQPVEVIDQDDYRTTYDYDSHGRLLTSSFGEAGGPAYVTEYVYNPRGLLEQVLFGTDGDRLLQSQMQYDASGQVSAELDALDLGETYLYESALPWPTTVTESASGSRRLRWDPEGRLLEERWHPGEADERLHTFHYDDVTGVVTETRFGIGAFTHHSDAAGRPRYTGPPSGEIARTYFYDAAGRTEVVVNDRDESLRYLYNALGQIERTLVGDWVAGAPTNEQTRGEIIAHHPDGRISKVTTAQRDTTYDYHPDGTLWKVTYPDLTVDELLYTPNRWLETETARGELTKTYSYDYGGLLSQVAESGSVTLPSGVRTINETVAILRDPYGRVRAEVVNGDAAAANDVAYYQNGQVARINNVHYDRGPATGLTHTLRFADRDDDYATYVPIALPPDASYPSVSLGYTSYGEPDTVQVGSTVVLDREYEASGLLKWVENPNSRFTFGYDVDGQPSGVARGPSGTATVLEQTTYDYVGERLESYTSDATGERHRYVYDGWGNLTEVQDYDTFAVLESRTVNWSNQLETLTTAGTRTYSYDARGQLASAVGGGAPDRSWEHDGFGRLLYESSPSGTRESLYDALDRLAFHSVGNATLSHLGQWVVALTDGGGTRRMAPQLGWGRPLLSYGGGEQLVPTWKLTTAEQVVTGDGALAETHLTSPFGRGSPGPSQLPFTYKGYFRLPSSEEYWVGARTYDATAAAFTTADPLSGSVDAPLSMNRYRTFSSDPVQVVDWRGLSDDLHPIGGPKSGCSGRATCPLPDWADEFMEGLGIFTVSLAVGKFLSTPGGLASMPALGPSTTGASSGVPPGAPGPMITFGVLGIEKAWFEPATGVRFGEFEKPPTFEGLLKAPEMPGGGTRPARDPSTIEPWELCAPGRGPLCDPGGGGAEGASGNPAAARKPDPPDQVWIDTVVEVVKAFLDDTCEAGGQQFVCGMPPGGKIGKVEKAVKAARAARRARRLAKVRAALRWGDPTSKVTYGHTFLEHSSKLSPRRLIDRARDLGTQVGKWADDKKAADFIAGVAKRGPGVHDVPLPKGIAGSSFLGDGTRLVPDMARVVVKPSGAVKTAFPFHSAFAN